MVILQIEHKIQNFDSWKKAFDNDPIDRRGSGVTAYRILQPREDPNYIIVELEFDNSTDADKTLAALRNLWTQVEGNLMFEPQARILKIAEENKISKV